MSINLTSYLITVTVLYYHSKLIHTNIIFRPPLIKVTDKVMIPQDDFPEINFVGLLIGPRGNTLKNLEKDVKTNNTKIM